ncbi:MAG: AIM24 family protein [Chloroflexi bacterium]|nr:AIM24 family protein [Chloroflexota bacterium]MCC6896593.1 AIM24 family protein [Anaerolineae bacterium]
MLSDFNNSIEIIESAKGTGGFSVDVIAYKRLEGGQDIVTAESLFMANQAGIKLKHVRIKLSNSSATLEPGALYFMKGNIKIEAAAGGSGGISGIARGLASKMLANETFFRPKYTGTGEIYLEPSFSHFIIVPLKEKQSLIVEKGMYFCSEGNVGVSVELNKNVAAGAFGGEGWFQTKIVGPGVCVLASPVPSTEILCYELQNETLQVDGNFALMRTDGIKFSVKKSTRSLLGSVASGEGLLQTFEGTGKVWIAPTQSVYSQIAFLNEHNKFMDHKGGFSTTNSSNIK